MHLPDPQLTVKLYIHFEGDGAAVVAVQLVEGVERPILAAGRRFLQSEEKLSEVEKYVVIASWALRKFPGVFLNMPRVEIVVPWQEYLECL